MIPYPGNNIDGWMGIEELTWLYQRAQEMSSIVEIGSWQGRSTHALLSGCRGPVVAVDKWDSELMAPYGDVVAARKAFWANVKGFSNLIVMEMDSIQAATAYRGDSLDMAFIDADHRYDAIKADILAWMPKIRKLICGHDHGCGWPGVDQAVKEIFGEKAKSYGALWYVELGS
jgi:hypothetical protein